ncbi:MAG TPA: hypothetical protein VNK43_02210 [Gemmatimonadales bacterium]|nr:hypothetical protein [Gemmatimonadales bacterium]
MPPIDDPLVAADRAALLETLMRGVIHDFRNALQTLVMVESVRAAEGAVPEHLQVLQADAVARLTRLLTTLDRIFTGDGDPGPVALPDVVGFVRDVEPFQRRLPTVTLVADLAPGLPAVRAPRAALEHALLRMLTTAKGNLGGRSGAVVRVTARAAGPVVELGVEHGPAPALDPGELEAAGTLAVLRRLAAGWEGRVWAEVGPTGGRVVVAVPAWGGKPPWSGP